MQHASSRLAQQNSLLELLEQFPDSTLSELTELSGLKHDVVWRSVNALAFINRAHRTGRRRCGITEHVADTWSATS